jgi:hypothetical protein
MAFAERNSTRNKAYGLFVIIAMRRTARDVPPRGDRVGIAVWVPPDSHKSVHLHGSDRISRFGSAAVAIVAEPCIIAAPINILFRFQTIFPTSSKSKVLNPIDSSRSCRQDIKSAHEILFPNFCLIGHEHRRAL